MKQFSIRVSALALLALWLGAPASAQQIEFTRIKREVIEARLRQSSTKNAEREAGLKKIFEEAGCQGERLTEQPVKGSRLPNLICTLPGATDSVIIVGAHFDQAEVGKGVVDNWSGASLLPSLFEGLRTHPRRHTFVFIGFTDEEKGLVGSEFYAKQLTDEQKAKTRAMVNMDSLGLSPTKVEVNRSDPKLVDLLDRVAQTLKLPVSGMNVDQVGLTDALPFSKRRVPVLSIHSVTQETLAVLHSPRDTLGAVKLDDYYDTYRLLAAYLAVLDSVPDPNPTDRAGQ